MADTIHATVRDNYGALARGRAGAENAGLSRIAAAFGYSPEDLATVPAEANLGVSCGNPVALASLQPGETVLDLGSGGGLDVFLAAERVGPQGRAIGIDMTADMIALARANAERRQSRNVEFIEAPIESMPLADASIDCVISNCVLNLVPDKDAAYREILRVLKPGGRLAVSDIALTRPLPDAIRASVTAWVGCVAGALTVEENRAALERAGFTEIVIADAGVDLNVYKEAGQNARSEPAQPASCCAGGDKPSGALHAEMAETFRAIDINSYAASVQIFALRPAPAGELL